MMRLFPTAIVTLSSLLVAIGADAATTSCSTVAACVFGTNTSSGYGVEGTSKANDGVVGITTENATSASTGKTGVAGYDSSTNKSQFNSGVYGTSQYGIGVQGKSASNIGIQGTGLSYGVKGIATGNSSTGVYASSPGGTAIEALSPQGYGLVASSFSGTALFIDTASGLLFQGANESTGRPVDVVTIDVHGNEILAGKLTTQGTPLLRTNTKTGQALTSYGARTSSPTLEDFGQGSLRQGQAHVMLEPAYSSTIDPRTYMVFITPQGDSRGLYTAAISPTGFDVRENGGGRSSLTFSYRIVGHPIDTNAQRLPVMAIPAVPPLSPPKVPLRLPKTGGN